MKLGNSRNKTQLQTTRNKLATQTVLLIFALTITLLIQGCAVHSNKKGWHPEGAELQSILQDFEKYAEKSMTDWQIPGMAVVIVRGDEVLYSKGLGVKMHGAADPINTNTLFQIGSTSKAFTATLVAMLVDEGLVNWDDKVIDHLPGFAMFDPEVTADFRVEDLMAQRSGMPGYSADFLSTAGYGREHIMYAIRHVKPISEFRTKFAYQNCLLLVAAKLVETKTGKTWEENVQERIFTPLAMNNTSTDSTTFKNSHDVTMLHKIVDDQLVVIPMNDPTAFDWLDIYSPAGGINSNIIDMVNWVKLNYRLGRLDNGQLVSSKNMAFLQTPKVNIESTSIFPSLSYCEGWMHGAYDPQPIIWHGGNTTGCGTMVAFIPRADIGIVILSNRSTNLPSYLAYYFFDRYFDNPMKDWSGEGLEYQRQKEEKEKKNRPIPPENPDPALPLASYVGQYANVLIDKFSVNIVDGKLELTIGPADWKTTLNHFNGDEFIDKNYNLITFETDGAGNVTGVKLPYLDEMDDDVLIKQ